MYFEWLKDLLREELEEGRDLDAVLKFLDDPAGEQAKREKRGKWMVKTEKKEEEEEEE